MIYSVHLPDSFSTLNLHFIYFFLLQDGYVPYLEGQAPGSHWEVVLWGEDYGVGVNLTTSSPTIDGMKKLQDTFNLLLKKV